MTEKEIQYTTKNKIQYRTGKEIYSTRHGIHGTERNPVHHKEVNTSMTWKEIQYTTKKEI